ncbi:MBL fold metallo-hydrolase (plasmid) [Phaeobacter sp. BS23]|uniref:MBL fold metallo-hydrolase n=1 Tax=Phaeobacter sp. BS23 TaxID=2907239 RepID=UPI0038705709
MSAEDVSLQVLGAAGGYPYCGHACSGFLLGTDGSAPLLVDCGPGVAAKLLAGGRACDLGAVVISHMHPDHILDLVSLGYALMTEWISLRTRKRIPLYLPQGGRAVFERLMALWGHKHWVFDNTEHGPGYAALRDVAAADRDWMFEVFEVDEFAPGDVFETAGFTVATIKADHTPEAVCLCFDKGGKRLGYTADTRYQAALIDFYKGCDLLIAEGHFSGSHPPGGAHMTPSEAGKLAEQSQVKRLLLTHIAAIEDGDAALKAARAAFAGPVELACHAAEIAL